MALRACREAEDGARCHMGWCVALFDICAGATIAPRAFRLLDCAVAQLLHNTSNTRAFGPMRRRVTLCCRCVWVMTRKACAWCIIKRGFSNGELAGKSAPGWASGNYEWVVLGVNAGTWNRE